MRLATPFTSLAIAAWITTASAFAAPAKTTDLWADLMSGNARYVSGKLTYPHLKEQRLAVAPSQNPHVSILSCADSRVPPELVFDKSVGDLFVVRDAGNVSDPFVLASLEFAVVSGYTNLIVVLSHESCGAIKAAVAEADPGTPSLDALVAEIRQSFDGSVKRGSNEKSDLFHATMLNAKRTAAELVAKSDVIRKAVDEGRVKIVAAYYDVDTGKVDLVKN